MRHKWDIITDICDNCGVQKQRRQLYTSDGWIKRGWLTQYLINNKWVAEAPKCKSNKE